ncbi:TPA: hypothetical protein DIC40_08360 [Patescibacteria group bacterium]|nr:hypothetical protein [Candidatus Gracilibacteria bacterium]
MIVEPKKQYLLHIDHISIPVNIQKVAKDCKPIAIKIIQKVLYLLYEGVQNDYNVISANAPLTNGKMVNVQLQLVLLMVKKKVSHKLEHLLPQLIQKTEVHLVQVKLRVKIIKTKMKNHVPDDF